MDFVTAMRRAARVQETVVRALNAVTANATDSRHARAALMTVVRVLTSTAHSACTL